jgi:regulatory protein
MISKPVAALRASGQKSKSSGSDPAGDPAAQAWQRAVRWLAAHDRSAHEVRERLVTQGFSPAIVSATIARLRELRYLDDQRFACDMAEQAVRRGHGSEYVRAQLGMKGIAEPLIDDAIGAAFEDEADLARRVLARHYPALPGDLSTRAKGARFLLRRGFPEALVFAILGEDC